MDNPNNFNFNDNQFKELHVVFFIWSCCLIKMFHFITDIINRSSISPWLSCAVWFIWLNKNSWIFLLTSTCLSFKMLWSVLNIQSFEFLIRFCNQTPCWGSTMTSCSPCIIKVGQLIPFKTSGGIMYLNVSNSLRKLS